MSKKVLPRFQIITSGSMGASITSAVTNIQYIDNIGIEIYVSAGSPVGTYAVQVSADYQQDAAGNVVNAGNWVSLSFSTAPDTTVNPIYLDMNQLSAPYIRLVYTRTSGTGTLQAYITGKEI